MQDFIELHVNGTIVRSALDESAEADSVVEEFENRVVRFNTETSGWDEHGNFLTLVLTRS